MNRIERAARKEPALYAFGTKPLRRLSAEEERGAPFEDRLVSVWGYIVKRARRFVATLSERERAHLGADDLVSAIVLDLLQKEKDSRWNPDRGRYVTFVEQVIRNVTAEERERARVVRAPSNARSRLEGYRAMAREGTLKRGQEATMRAIESVLGEVEGVSVAAGPVTDPGLTPGDAAREESAARDGRDVITALRSLEDPLHALVLARSWGLFGSESFTPTEIARSLPEGYDAKKVRSIRVRAETSLRSKIRKLRADPPHPRRDSPSGGTGDEHP